MLDTSFADPSRADAGTLARQVRCFFANPVSSVFMESVEGYLLVLNEHRQILTANPELLSALGVAEGDALIGLRPGEAMDCAHAAEGPQGCGTSSSCAECGAVLAILAAQTRLQPAEGECRILMRRNGRVAAAEFQVRVTPLGPSDRSFLAMVLVDISDRKRKEVLERLFFHDLGNTVQCLEGWSERLQPGSAPSARTGAVLQDLVRRLGNQVRHHRLLFQAERGELELHFRRIRCSEILAALEAQFRSHELAASRLLAFLPPRDDLHLYTDPELLQRVLGNMVLNALEAARPGEQVTIWQDVQEDRPAFHVSNPGEMPGEVARQVFHRFFSTKDGTGRGLGTYGMKLLGEDHLGGTVSFRSTAREGTCFTIVLPRDPGGPVP
jgi:signal transduction histidine kinase